MHATEGPDIKLYFLFLRIELIEINFDIFDLILIFLKLSVGFVLRVEMREDFIIDSEFERLALLDDVEGEPLESEGVLEGDVGGEFVFEEDLSVDCYFDFSWDEWEIQDYCVVLVFEGYVPGVSLLAAFDVLADLVHLESEGLNLLHLFKLIYLSNRNYHL